MARFQKGEPRPANAGRRKGTPNKSTAAIKQAWIDAFVHRGGVQGLIDWAATNPDEFYKQIAKFIPMEVTGAEGAPLTEIVVRIVDAKADAGDSASQSTSGIPLI